MSRKGFSLVEVIITITIISVIVILATKSINSTLSISKNETYKLMKNNLLKASYNYINECKAGLIECDLSFQESDSNITNVEESSEKNIENINNTFNASVLRTNGYFKNLESPIDGKDLGECLVLEVTATNGVVVIDLIDNCYL